MFGMPKKIAKEMAKLLEACDSVYFLVARQSFVNSYQMGEIVINFWLSAARQNLFVHPVSVLIQHDHIKDLVAKILKIDGDILFENHKKSQ